MSKSTKVRDFAIRAKELEDVAWSVSTIKEAYFHTEDMAREYMALVGGTVEYLDYMGMWKVRVCKTEKLDKRSV